MKRLLPALLVLCLLSSCFLTPSPEIPDADEDCPTEEEVAASYEEAAQIYDWFTRISPPCSGEAVCRDGTMYRAVDIPELTTYADLEAKVRSCFSPELSDQLLAQQLFRDIDGRLYCAEGGRGDNPSCYDKTIRVEKNSPQHFTVTLTFWTDESETVQPALPGTAQLPTNTESTFGYSRKVLDYEKLADGYRFTSFCASDDLDPDADTIYTFRYGPDFENNAYRNYTDWQLIAYLCNADGAAAEEPVYDLLLRFLKRPQEILAQLALLYESPFYGNPEFPQMDTIVLLPTYTAASRLAPDEQPDFLAALDGCHPETRAQHELLDLLRQEFTALTADAEEYSPDSEFSLLLPGNPLVMTLGEQVGTFPWDFDLKGTLTKSAFADSFGISYTMDCGTVKLQYFVKNGIETLYSMETTTPHADSGGLYSTPRGIYCGFPEQELQQVYLHAVELENFQNPDYDSCYVYEVQTKHIAFYCKNGVVAKIVIENLFDEQLLN